MTEAHALAMHAVLQEVEEYLDAHADINSAGGPNGAMLLLAEVQAVLAKVEGK